MKTTETPMGLRVCPATYTGKKRDDRLLLELASGKPVPDAAKAAGLSRVTAYRRLQDPAFRAKVDAARSDMMDRVIGQFTDAATEAITLLRRQLGSKSEMVAQRAAIEIANFAFKGHEVADLKKQQQAILERLDAMEAARPRRIG